MKKLFLSIPVLSALLLFGSTCSYGKEGKFIIHYKDKQADTVSSGIQYSENGEHFMENGNEVIDASSTEEIEYISSENKVIKGVSSGGNWFFKVLQGDPVSLYAMDPEKYKANELFFSIDGKRFVSCSRENVKQFFGSHEETDRELEKYLAAAGVQKFLLYSNISAAPGFLIGLATPAGLGLVSYGLASTGASILMNKSVKKKLYMLVDEFNKSYMIEEEIQEDFKQRYSQL